MEKRIDCGEVLALTKQHGIPAIACASSDVQTRKEFARFDLNGNDKGRTSTFHYLVRSKGVSRVETKSGSDEAAHKRTLELRFTGQSEPASFPNTH